MQEDMGQTCAWHILHWCGVLMKLEASLLQLILWASLAPADMLGVFATSAARQV